MMAKHGCIAVTQMSCSTPILIMGMSFFWRAELRSRMGDSESEVRWYCYALLLSQWSVSGPLLRPHRKGGGLFHLMAKGDTQHALLHLVRARTWPACSGVPSRVQRREKHKFHIFWNFVLVLNLLSETDDTENSPKIPTIVQCQIPRPIARKKITEFFWRAGKVI